MQHCCPLSVAGTLGRLFQRSFAHNVIRMLHLQGWDRGMMEMSLGEKAVLNIAPFMGYGPQGAPPTIPPMSPLVFTIELLAIERKVAS